MLEIIVDNGIIFGLMGVIAGLGVICKLITVFTLKRLVKAAGKIGKSTHKLMKLVKAKYEHTFMLSNRVENTVAFVEKYLFEYKVFGIRLHSYRHFGKQTIWLCGFLGFAGAMASYRLNGMTEVTFRYFAFGGFLMVLMLLVRISTDEAYQFEAIKMYIMDYLENVCSPRYEKQQVLKSQRLGNVMRDTTIEPMPEIVGEIREPEIIGEKYPEPEIVPKIEEVKEQESVLEEEKSESLIKEPEEKKVPQEVILREILEDFLKTC